MDNNDNGDIKMKGGGASSLFTARGEGGGLFFFLAVLGFELRSLCLQSRSSTTWSTLPVHFALVILEMEPHELLPQAGLKPRSS
jgi:hypothetical protein